MARQACAACGNPVTDDDLRIEIAGLRRHTGTNPGGWTYVVACFAAATGVDVRSNPSREWSWFPGWRWQVEACARCGAHLGWLFTKSPPAEARFHGLIEANLRVIEDSAIDSTKES